MRINSISFKLISITLLITTTVLCGLGFYGYQETKNRLAESLDSDTRLLLRRLNLNLPGALWNFDDAYIASTLESEARAYFISGIYVLNDSGELINGIEQKNKELTVVDALPEGLDVSQATDLEYIDKDTGERNKVGKLLLDITDEKNRELLEEEVLKIIIQIAALNLILIFLFAIAVGRMTRPLGELKTVAGSIADGNYDLELAIKRKDEIGELADSFNRMKTGIKKKVQDLRDLNATGDALASSSTQTAALEKALNSLSIHSRVNSGSVYLYNQDNQLEIKSYYPPKQAPGSSAKQFSEGEGIVGLSAKLSEIIFVPDTSKDQRFVSSFEGEAKSLICVPLMDGDISLGVLNLSGQIGEVQFEESDYEYVQTIARQLVTTVKNIRMRETIEEQNRTLEQKVEERTAELRQKNYDIQGMLHNMQQGLFTVMQGGVIHPEYSSYLESIFEISDLAGKDVFDLLFKQSNLGSNDLDQNKVAVDAIIGEDEMMFDFNEHLLAREYECTVNDKKKILSLDWNPIVVEGEVSKLMVTVRDVTQLKELEFAAASQKRELDIVGQLIKIPARKFLDFEATARKFVSENRTKIEATSAKDVDTLALLFRNMHTIKGNARTYGFVHLTDIVHDVESRYSELRTNEEAEWDAGLLLEELTLVEKGLDEYGHVFHQVLGRGDAGSEGETGAGLDEATVKRIEDCLASINSKYPEINTREELAPLHSLINNAHTCQLDTILADIINSLPSIAKELGKANPVVNIQADNIRIENKACDLMNNVFSHLLRNSVDHGIELPQERLEAGKPESGRIDIETQEKSDHLEIVLRDDGKGINLTRLQQKGIENGVFAENDQPTAEQIASLIFYSGVSTKEAVSSISGRGVGMDAVKQFLLQNGGDISLRLLAERSQDSDFVPFETIISLPKGYYVTA